MAGYVVENNRIAAKWTRHGLLFFNRNDLFIGRALDLYGEWCEAEITLLRQVLRPGDIVVDAGANIGTHTVAFSNIVGAGGSVYAIEPQRHVFNILCTNVAVNLRDNVRCLQKAAGDEAGFVNMPVLSPDQPRNFGAIGAGSSGEKVEMFRIDDLDLPACRLLKIDVEGAEPATLKGCAETIRRHRPFLFVECNDVSDAAGIIGAAEGFDYDLWWHIAGYFSPANFLGNPVNIFERFHPEANLFCAPKESRLPVGGLESCKGVSDNWRAALDRIGARAGAA